MTQPSAADKPPVPLPPTGTGSTSHTLAIGATILGLAVWAALTWGAPWLAEPVSEGWLAIEQHLVERAAPTEEDG